MADTHLNYPTPEDDALVSRHPIEDTQSTPEAGGLPWCRVVREDKCALDGCEFRGSRYERVLHLTSEHGWPPNPLADWFRDEPISAGNVEWCGTHRRPAADCRHERAALAALAPDDAAHTERCAANGYGDPACPVCTSDDPRRVTGDAGLREAAQAVVESWAAVDVAVTGTLDGAEILRRGDALRDALDALRREYAALTDDTPEAQP